MINKLSLALAQINPTVGDVLGNIERIRAARRSAAEARADLILFSELVVTGYPPEDLALCHSFQDTISASVYPKQPCYKLST
jgi:NAD+ synthase